MASALIGPSSAAAGCAPARSAPAGRSVPTLRCMSLGPVAVGTWSGGRFMRFGEPIEDDRLIDLLTPDEAIHTVLTADVYGEGAADEMLGRARAVDVGGEDGVDAGARPQQLRLPVAADR